MGEPSLAEEMVDDAHNQDLPPATAESVDVELLVLAKASGAAANASAVLDIHAQPSLDDLLAQERISMAVPKLSRVNSKHLDLLYNIVLAARKEGRTDIFERAYADLFVEVIGLVNVKTIQSRAIVETGFLRLLEFRPDNLDILGPFIIFQKGLGKFDDVVANCRKALTVREDFELALVTLTELFVQHDMNLATEDYDLLVPFWENKVEEGMADYTILSALILWHRDFQDQEVSPDALNHAFKHAVTLSKQYPEDRHAFNMVFELACVCGYQDFAMNTCLSFLKLFYKPSMSVDDFENILEKMANLIMIYPELPRLKTKALNGLDRIFGAPLADQAKVRFEQFFPQ